MASQKKIIFGETNVLFNYIAFCCLDKIMRMERKLFYYIFGRVSFVFEDGYLINGFEEMRKITVALSEN